MKVLFINFNIGSTPGINNGLAILSAVLKDKGHAVALLFLCEEMGYPFDLERIRKDIVAARPDIIGISLMEPQFKYMQELLPDLRRYFKGFVLCGGPFPSMDPETVLSVDGVDAVCVGEGEDALSELVESIESGNDYTRTPNLFVKMPDGTVVRNRLRPFRRVDNLPAEDKELFDLEKLLRFKNHQLETMLGRGCVHKCSYCINEAYIDQYKNLCDEPISVSDYIRTKSIDTVIKEIISVTSRHEVTKISFIDDNFLMYKNFMENFSGKYKEEVGLPFLCNINPMSFDMAKGSLLKEAGCEVIRFGLESGSERVKREIMKRSITNESVVNAFKIAEHLGLMTSSYNMIGLPTETAEEVLMTLKLNAAIRPDTVKIMTFYPFKNTPIYDLCVKHDLIDYEKKRELDDYDTFTCLKFSPKHQLFLKKIQTAFIWYLNVYLGNAASARYRELTADIESMDEAEWESFDFHAADKDISNRMKKDNIVHYTNFPNTNLAVRFPSGQLCP